MKKQILALGLIFTLSVAVTNCSRDEAEQITNKENNKPTRSDILSGNAAPLTYLQKDSTVRKKLMVGKHSLL